jgi:hypothetical protein
MPSTACADRATPAADRSCLVCGEGVDHLRADAKYCGDEHRAWHHDHPGEPLPEPRSCGWCDAELTWQRADARFCDSTCRSAAWRASLEPPATALNGYASAEDPSPTPWTPENAPQRVASCSFCDSPNTYVDTDGRWCNACGRLTAAVRNPDPLGVV